MECEAFKKEENIAEEIKRFAGNFLLSTCRSEIIRLSGWTVIIITTIYFLPFGSVLTWFHSDCDAFNLGGVGGEKDNHEASLSAMAVSYPLSHIYFNYRPQ